MCLYTSFHSKKHICTCLITHTTQSALNYTYNTIDYIPSLCFTCICSVEIRKVEIDTIHEAIPKDMTAETVDTVQVNLMDSSVEQEYTITDSRQKETTVSSEHVDGYVR